MIHNNWLTLSETTLIELEQSADEGRDVMAYADEARLLHDAFLHGQRREDDARRLLERIRCAPLGVEENRHEPSTLEEIKRDRPIDPDIVSPPKPTRAVYEDKVYGAWLGRCCGCLLGQPVEGWRRARITGLLRETDNYPIARYISSDIGAALREKYGIKDDGHVYGSLKINWVNNITCMPEDDDTNYTVIALKIMERYGRAFTSDDVAQTWLQALPALRACTAERAAYRNLLNGIWPPLSADRDNAYREWIGAQIRADFWGYINPGDPTTAAEYAWRDARVSHVKNGIYGAMFCAAMLAHAAVSDNVEDLIARGVDEIPGDSRLTEGINQVFEWRNDRNRTRTWEDVIERLHQQYNEKNPYHWGHTIPNAMICAIALLWGERDLAKTIGIAVSAGFDTDCNGATTGSIIGMLHGARQLPSAWTAPLNDGLKSGIDGFGQVKISELAQRTADLAYAE
ncbi:MAG: ADP-ribosylglycohydrolase family protein [Verrucomicrobiales bacterium]|jgi:ADP-ribosylglycohydrolase|nr:ADP-ribosylglycohydrolase family protein [Verrucomicrobiales bacterium]